MIVSRLPLSLFVALPLAFAACGGDSLTLPPEGAAAHIQVMAETNNQSARVGELLPQPLQVMVTDTRDRPVAGATVVFTIPDGESAGDVEPGSATTDADGHASTTLTLGSRAGPVTGTAAVEVADGAEPVQTTFAALALPANANGIRLVSGDPQNGTVNSTLLAPLVVQVTDAAGNPISGVTIEWTVAGGGSVSAASTVTGSDGQTSVTRTLGGTAGEQTTFATAVTSEPLAGSPVTFTHIATAGSATGVVKFSGDKQSGSPGERLGQPLVVQVLDGGGNPIPDRDVTWVIGQGGGSVSPVDTRTDAEGKASTQWTLGPSTGDNTVNAVVSGVGTATFSAVATAGAPSAANSDVSASPTTITAGTGTSTITVVVRDGSNNPVAGASVSIASSGSGNTITPASASTGPNGVATFSFSSTVAETKTITATAGGVTITDQASVTVQKASSTTEITSDDPDPSTAGQAVVVEFTVTGSGGGTPTGNVVVTISGGTETCSSTLVSGSGACSLPVTAAGSGPGNRRTITATYGGDAQFSGDADTENHRVDPAPAASTTTTITSHNPNPSDPGAPITVTFTVTSSAGTPSGDVVVTDMMTGGGCTATVAQGSCQYSPEEPGTRTIRARYAGSAGFSPSEDNEQHTVNPPRASTTQILSVTPEPSQSGSAITVTFRVTGEGGGTPTGTVAVYSDQESGAGCEAAPLNEAGEGSCNFVLNSVNTHTIRAAYFGDARFEPSEDPDGQAHVVIP